MKESPGVLIPAREVEGVLSLLRKLQLVNPKLKFIRTTENVLIPVSHKPSPKETQTIRSRCPNARIQPATFEEVRIRPRDLAECMHEKIPEHLLKNLPRSFDIIGDIAIVELPEELFQFSRSIGGGIMQLSPNVRLVTRKSGEVTGVFRTRSIETIAGEGNTVTVHKEYSCLYHLDIAKVYFNPRLSWERMRVARQVKAGERVVDMFAGVGPYSVLIAKTQPSSRIHSIDINPDAITYLRENILLNKVADRVTWTLGDARKSAAELLRGTADRVIMNLPSESKTFLDVALTTLKESGGAIHFYTFASRADSVNEIKESIRSIIHDQGFEVRSFSFSDIIREVAPNRVQVALDIECGRD